MRPRQTGKSVSTFPVAQGARGQPMAPAARLLGQTTRAPTVNVTRPKIPIVLHPVPSLMKGPGSSGFQATGGVRRTLTKNQIKKPGNDLLSHRQAAVPSARQGLTSVFGMGTGGSPALWSPGNTLYCSRGKKEEECEETSSGSVLSLSGVPASCRTAPYHTRRTECGGKYGQASR
jgi:hypothetical protein